MLYCALAIADWSWRIHMTQAGPTRFLQGFESITYIMDLLEERDHDSSQVFRAAPILTFLDSNQHYTFIPEMARLFLALASLKDPMKMVSALMS